MAGYVESSPGSAVVHPVASSQDELDAALDELLGKAGTSSASPLVKWSHELHSWQRDALRRIAQKAALTVEDWEELKSALLAKHGLAQFQKELVPFAEEHCRSANASGERYVLCSIGPVKNVNRLAEGQPPLRFTPTGITLVYGDNGSGKSGYCRIAKKVCRARVEDDLLGNAFAKEKSGKPVVSIRWKADSATDVQESDWSPDQPAPAPLSTVSVFDSKNAALYVDGDNQLEYLPFEVDLVQKLAELCIGFNAELNAEIDAAKKGLVVLPDFTPDTAVSSLVGRVKQATKAEDLPAESEIEDLAVWRVDVDEVSLQTLLKLVAADPVHQADIRSRCISACVSVSGAFEPLEGALSDAAVQELKRKHDALVVAKAANEAAAAKEFQSMPLAHVGSDAWRQLFEHARAYSELAYPGQKFPYTGDGAKCVMCQQELDDRAKERLIRFDDFVKDRAAQEYDIRKKELSGAVKVLTGLPILGGEDIRQRLAEFSTLGADHVSMLNGLIAASGTLAKRRDEAFAAALGQSDFGTLTAVPVTVEPLKEIIQKLKDEEQSLRKEATDDAARQIQVKELRNLEDKKALFQNRANVLRYRADRERILGLTACQADLATAGLSRKVTELRKVHFTDKLNEKIEAEIKGLGLSHLNVKIKDRTDKGKSQFSSDIGLQQKAAKSAVLSEGEQRALALACFLAETELEAGKNGLVIDDPVSSLDQERIRRVAERLVEAASDGRQVVIFTHNLVFYQEVRSAAAAHEPQVEVSPHVIHYSGGETFGIIKEGDLPDLARRIKERIPVLQADLAAAKAINPGEVAHYQKAVERFYSELRKTWERLVEEILLGGVVERFTSVVKTQSLKGVIVDSDDYRVIFHAMKRASEYSGHDRAIARKLALPDHSELESDLQRLIDYRKAVTKRRNEISEQREALEEAPKGALI